MEFRVVLSGHEAWQNYASSAEPGLDSKKIVENLCQPLKSSAVSRVYCSHFFSERLKDIEVGISFVDHRLCYESSESAIFLFPFATHDVSESWKSDQHDDQYRSHYP